MSRQAVCIGAILLSLAVAGCRKKAPQPAPAPPPIPASKKPVKPPVLEPPSTEAAKPAAVPEVKKPPLPVTAQPEPQAPPPVPEKKPAARTPRPSRTKPPAPVPAEAAPQTPPVEAPAEAPKLGEVLTPEQRQQNVQAFEASRTETRQALAQLEKRKLNKEQTETAARARNFLVQAEGLVETDPRTAAQLAKRAELLAQDLLRDLH